MADSIPLDKRRIQRVPSPFEPHDVVRCLGTRRIKPFTVAVTGAALMIARCLLRLVREEREEFFDREFVDSSRFARRCCRMRQIVLEAADNQHLVFLLVSAVEHVAPLAMIVVAALGHSSAHSVIKYGAKNNAAWFYKQQKLSKTT